MAVWRHVARVHVSESMVPFNCECGQAFRNATEAARHLDSLGCERITVGPLYEPQIFRLLIVKYSDVIVDECVKLEDGLESISDTEDLEYLPAHLPDFNCVSGLLPFVPDCPEYEDVSDTPMDFYLSDSESECSDSSSDTAVYASDVELSLFDSDDDMFDILDE